MLYKTKLHAWCKTCGNVRCTKSTRVPNRRIKKTRNRRFNGFVFICFIECLMNQGLIVSCLRLQQPFCMTNWRIHACNKAVGMAMPLCWMASMSSPASDWLYPRLELKERLRNLWTSSRYSHLTVGVTSPASSYISYTQHLRPRVWI